MSVDATLTCRPNNIASYRFTFQNFEYEKTCIMQTILICNNIEYSDHMHNSRKHLWWITMGAHIVLKLIQFLIHYDDRWSIIRLYNFENNCNTLFLLILLDGVGCFIFETFPYRGLSMDYDSVSQGRIHIDVWPVYHKTVQTNI